MSKSDSTQLTSDKIDPDQEADSPIVVPSFGWNAYAEVVNGRLAMLAIVGLLALEWFSKQDLLSWLGLW